MGQRRAQRITTSLTVRVFGSDKDGRPFTRLAQTVDVSSSGARISGIYVALSPGDVIGLQYGSGKCRFRVVWVGKRGSATAGEIGLQALETCRDLWRLDLSSSGEDTFQAAANLSERRRERRYECDLGVEFKIDAGGAATYARCTDISLGGCYLETWTPLAVATQVFLAVRLPKGNVETVATVRTSHPGFGMGLEFSSISSPAPLRHFLEQQKHRLDGAANKDLAVGAEQRMQPATSLCSRPANAGTSPTPTMAHALRILIAEDSKFLRNAYAYCLKKEGMQVLVADDGEQALHLATAERPDVVVLDLLMPKLGGMDVLKLLKNDPMTSDIPVIVLSGLSQNNEAKLISAGAFTYLEKAQVGPEALTGVIHRALAACKPDSSSLRVPNPGFQALT